MPKHCHALLFTGTLVVQVVAACSGADSTASSSPGGASSVHGGSTAVSTGSAVGGIGVGTDAPGTPAAGGVAAGGASSVGYTTAAGAPAAGGQLGSGGVTTVGGGASNGGTTASTTSTAGTARGGTSSNGGSAANGGNLAKGGSSSIGGSAANGGATGTDCNTPPPPSSLVGWAAVSGSGTTTTTGGGTVSPVVVTNLAGLQAAANGTAASVIYVKGTMAQGDVTVGSNKTIVGICGAEIHGHMELSGSVNVIIRNIKVVGYGVGDCSKDPSYSSATGCSSGVDAITVQNSAHHIWFDHCDISDGTDGNLDITKASDYITVSWTKFHYTPRTDNTGSDSTGASGHRYSNLIGGSDTEASAGKLNITWHHNWWADNVHERQPQVRFGKNHLFNNLWTSSADNYCVRAVIDAHLFLESNVFSDVKDPHLFYGSASSTSNIAANSTNTYTNTSGSKLTGGSGTAYTPTYSYAPDATAQVQTLVQNANNGAGPH